MNVPDIVKRLLHQQTIPDWANWVAQDADGQWWIYQAEPLLHHRGWYENEIGVYQKLGQSSACMNWQEQLFRLK